MIKSIILYVNKVTFVRGGGRRIRFCVYSLLRKKYFIGLGKGVDYDFVNAINKSYIEAKSTFSSYRIKGNTIDSFVYKKVGKTLIKLFPVSYIVGIIAGGVIRIILKFINIINVVTILIGVRNKINMIKATYLSLINDEGR